MTPRGCSHPAQSDANLAEEGNRGSGSHDCNLCSRADLTAVLRPGAGRNHEPRRPTGHLWTAPRGRPSRPIGLWRPDARAPTSSLSRHAGAEEHARCHLADRHLASPASHGHGNQSLFSEPQTQGRSLDIRLRHRCSVSLRRTAGFCPAKGGDSPRRRLISSPHCFSVRPSPSRQSRLSQWY